MVIKKNNFATFLLILPIILLVVLVIWPIFKEIKNNAKELISQRNNLATLRAETENINNLKLVYNDFNKNLQRIDAVLIAPTGTPVEFIDFLEKTAKDSQVQMKISSTSFIQGKENQWSFWTFQLDVAGTFAKAASFLEKIEKAPYLIEVQSLNISQLKGENSVQINFNLKIYTSR